MKLNPGQLIYEGKAKKIFSTDKDDLVLVEFKNDTTAFNALKRESLEGKGRINCEISARLFKMLELEGIHTHFIEHVDDNWMIVQRVEVIPLEVVIRNIATGSLCKQTPILEGLKLSPPLLDFYYKDDNLSDPLLTDARLDLIGLINPTQKSEIEKVARAVNDILIELFKKIDLKLVDFKLEFGINNKGQLIVADEISPDNCRIWDERSDDQQGRILDKDRFRKGLGGVVDAYGEILKRVQGASSNLSL